MTKAHVAFIELTVFAGVYPLASGYMRGVASQNERVRDAYDFEIQSICINKARFEDELAKIDADVYAVSCYVWNMGLVCRWLPKLLAQRPSAKVILGGPQVMNHAERYLDPKWENVVLCNGEGEYTFTHYLEQLVSSEPDLCRVNGLSFYRDGELITTESQGRIQDLNTIPSPYLEGYLDSRKYVWAPLETNRGCPYQCTYCFWGAATNAKVYKSDMDRVKAEITWLAQNRALYIFITDANFGMLNRDIEIAEHIAACKHEYGYPMTVWLSAAKNSPDRVTKITRVLSAEGLISAQPVSLQTMDATTLKAVQRSNIKESSYLSLQNELHNSKLSSFVEMIWPLPGETLASFKSGLGKLCRYDADALVIHHLLLINNVKMNSQREEYRMETTKDADSNSEAEVVIATRDVSREDYKEGVRFGFHLTSLFSLRGLRFVMRHLDSTGEVLFEDSITKFSDYTKRFPDDPYVQYIESVIAVSGQTKFSANGGIFHVSLFEFRKQFDGLLNGFMESLGVLQDPMVRFLFEVDLLNRPHIYYNTPISNGDGLLKMIQIVSKDKDGYLVRVPGEYAKTTADLFGLSSSNPKLRIKYHTTQMPFMENKPYEDNLSYCEARLHKMASIMPVWSPAGAEPKVLTPMGSGVASHA